MTTATDFNCRITPTYHWELRPVECFLMLIRTIFLEFLLYQINPSPTLGNYFSPILGVGLSFISKNIFLGVSTPGLLNKIGFNKNKDWELTSRDYTYLHLSGGFKFNLSEKFMLKPSAIYRSMPRGPNLINSILEIDYSDRFSLGSIYTNNNTIGAFFKLKSKKGFQIGYGYEFLTGNDRYQISNSTHELMLRLELKKKSKKIVINDK